MGTVKKKKNRTVMETLKRDFFSRPPQVVAQDLLGKILVYKNVKNIKLGKITETEAYLGFGDRASHSHKGITKRNEVMFGPAGHAYVYFTYGMHWLLNIITEEEGAPSGVLIRALEPLYDSEQDISTLKPSQLKKLSTGPARLTKWMGIDGYLNREDIVKSSKLFVADRAFLNGQVFNSEKVNPKKIISAPRIGVDYAGEDADLPLRFLLKD
jgi:DNA-3-methyladenine glycosylase